MINSTTFYLQTFVPINSEIWIGGTFNCTVVLEDGNSTLYTSVARLSYPSFEWLPIDGLYRQHNLDVFTPATVTSIIFNISIESVNNTQLTQVYFGGRFDRSYDMVTGAMYNLALVCLLINNTDFLPMGIIGNAMLPPEYNPPPLCGRTKFGYYQAIGGTVRLKVD
jgi:hypothetical protein